MSDDILRAPHWRSPPAPERRVAIYQLVGSSRKSCGILDIGFGVMGLGSSLVVENPELNVRELWIG